MSSDSDHNWQCTSCGVTKESKVTECTNCGSEESVSVRPRAIVHTKTGASSEHADPELASINHVNVDNVAAMVTESPSIRVDVLAVVIVLIGLQAIVGMLTFDPRYGFSVIPLLLGYGLLLYVRRPHEGVTVESLTESRHFGGDPAPFVDRFESAQETLLTYASGWRTWLYVIDQEYWLAPAHVDCLIHEQDTARNPILWALLAGIGAGALVGFLGVDRLSQLEKLAAGLGVTVFVGAVVWLLLRKLATTDIIDVRTTSGRTFQFPLSPSVAEEFRERFGTALDDQSEDWVDINHASDRTERLPIPRVTSLIQFTHSWSTLAIGVGLVAHLMTGAIVWQVTGSLDFSVIQRVLFAGAAVLLLGILVYVFARQPDGVTVASQDRRRSLPTAESTEITDTLREEMGQLITLEHTVDTLFEHEQRVTWIDPSEVAIIEHVETDATWIRRPVWVGGVCLLSLVGGVAAFVLLAGQMQLTVIGGSIILAGAVLIWAWTGSHYAKVQFSFTNGETQSYLLSPSEATAVVEDVCSVQDSVVRREERAAGGLLKLVNWHRTVTRYAYYPNIGLVTPFFPSLSWIRRGVLGCLTALTFGGTYYVYTSITADFVVAGGAFLFGGLLTFLVYGFLLDDPGLRIVTTGGELRVYDQDNDEIVADLESKRPETLELSTGSTETNCWHVVPPEIVSLEQHRPPLLPSALLVVLTLISSAGAAYGAFQEFGTGPIEYALIAGVFVGSLFVFGGIYGFLLELLGFYVFDRLVADLAGEPRIRDVLEDDADFTPFDEERRRPEHDATIYSVSVPPSERGTPLGRLWNRIRGNTGSADSVSGDD